MFGYGVEETVTALQDARSRDAPRLMVANLWLAPISQVPPVLPMLDVGFSRLPPGVSQIVFQDAIFQYVRSSEERPRVVMDGRSVKQSGGGYLKFPSETAATDFLAKVRF